MNHEKLRELVHTGIDRRCAALTSTPYRVQRVLNMAQDAQITGGIITMKPRKTFISLIILACILLTSTVGMAWSLSRDYFADIALITLTSGDYESWSLEEKRYMMTIMGKYGLIPEAEAKALSHQSEKDIDAFMLNRYAFDSAPDDPGNISLTRIAWVEMGPYTDWDNETWVWYTKLMFEVGLWNETNDVDVYKTPGEEAIPPQEAVRLAEEYLISKGFNVESVHNAWHVWHYMTHASDTEMRNMTYCITFRFEDASEQYVFISPEGQIKE